MSYKRLDVQLKYVATYAQRQRYRLPASQDQYLGQRAQIALYADSIRAGFRPRTSPPTPAAGRSIAVIKNLSAFRLLCRLRRNPGPDRTPCFPLRRSGRGRRPAENVRYQYRQGSTYRFDP